MSGVKGRPRELVLRTGRDEAGAVLVTVRDSGVGLDPDRLEQIFDPFYSTKREGMGMGLAIGRSIAENHGGRLWASANDGPGATFAFTIPVPDGAA
jgi:signal transduction histidine kinase